MRKKWAGWMSTLIACSLMLEACSGSSGVQPTVENTVSVSETATPTESTTQEDTTGKRPMREAVAVLARPVKAKEIYQIAASQAVLSGNCDLSKDYVEGFKEDGDMCTFTVDVEDGYFYDISVLAQAIGGNKINNLLVDGEFTGTFSTTKTTGEEACTVSRVYLDKGTHQISVSKSWGWIKVFGMELKMSAEPDLTMYDIPAKLIDSKASDNTKRLMSYLTDVYGRYILTGQYYSKVDDIMAIVNETGKRPAVLGLDFIEFSPSRVKLSGNTVPTDKMTGVVKLAETMYSDNNEIITFCWHWNAPEKYLVNSSEHPWYSGFYKEATTIDLKKIMNGEDEEGYELLLNDIDAIAAQLKLLAEKDVPILWRPLHEASGGWFWWGAHGADSYKKLWVLLYDRLTNYHDLHNLIWLWNGQAKDWYPGDEYVDIIGEDIYPGKQVAASQASKFFEANEYTTEKKMVVLSENGCIPDPDLCIRDGAMWGFYATWNGEFVREFGNYYSEEYTTREILKKMYSHEKTITMDELPDLKHYPIYSDDK